MLIQATSWSDATQRPSLLYGREEGLGWGETVCVYTVFMCVFVGVLALMCPSTGRDRHN